MPSASSIPPAKAADVLPRLGLRDPDFWLAVAASCVIGFSALQILLFSFGRDQGIYAVMGAAVLDGQLPYRDVWDFKPPGIHLLYALGQLLFGRTMLAPRLLEVLGLLVQTFCFVRLGELLFGNRRIGLVGAALAALVHAELEFWHTGQPETFAGFFTVGALLLTFRDTARRFRWLSWALVGALFGCAFLLKPPLGGGALVCAAYLIRAEQARTGRASYGSFAPLLGVALGALVPIGLCALWFKVSGAWPAARWTLFEFTPGYTRLGWVNRSAPEMFYWAIEEVFFKFSALNAFGFAAALLIAPIHGREREALFVVLGIVSVQLAGICMQGKFFAYHYAATLSLLAFIAGLGLYKLWRRCLSGGPAGALVFVLFVLVAAVMRGGVPDLESFWRRSRARLAYALRLTGESRELLDAALYAVADYNLEADRRLARELQQRTRPTDSVYIWGFEPGVYFLSDRRPASRFIYNVPQRVTWERDYARGELMRDLERNAPAAIVVQRYDVFPAVTGDALDSRDSLPAFAELASLIDRDYELTTTVEDFELYERRAPAPITAPRVEPDEPAARNRADPSDAAPEAGAGSPDAR